jgi:hypothetical protein
MVRTRAIARLAMLAVGLGIGGALASTPGIAAADSSDWLSSIDSLLSGSAVPAAATSDLNLAISFDGATLFQEGTAEAYTGSGGDIAIANGAGSVADAYGTNNYADVDGTDSTAVAGGVGSSNDTAFVFGDNSYAFAGGTAENPGTFDYSVIFGNDDTALSGGDAAGAGSYDGSYVEGNDLGVAHAQGSDYLADILKFYGDSSSSTAAAAADSSSHLTDLLSAFDAPSAASDTTNFLTELASLF